MHDPDFDWGDDHRPYTRWRETVIYELHVKGMTALHDRVPEHLRGTYAGLATPAVTDYLRDLGVTAVELLPVQQFVSEPHVMARGMANYWGYNTLGFFAPHHAYSSAGDRGGQVREFKEMVRSFHAAGLEVILDVVYNHTAEGEAAGPTLSFRGLDDRGFYHRFDHRQPGDPLLRHDDDTYWDITGCGNTVNTSDPFALRLVLDSLRYWTSQMRVDGFRFDLASALARVRARRRHGLAADDRDRAGPDAAAREADRRAVGPVDGRLPRRRVPARLGGVERPVPRHGPRLLARALERDPHRRHPARRLVRPVRRRRPLAVRLGELRDRPRRLHPARPGVLRVTSTTTPTARATATAPTTTGHRASGSRARPTTRDVVALRRRTAANLLVTLCLSNGVPMITAGDERGRTQGGNNNPYVQDNPVSWVDWRADDAWLDVYEITKSALRLRREHPALRQRHWFEGRPTIVGGRKDLMWVHPEGREMTGDDWADNELAVVGMLVTGDPLRSPGPRGEQEWDSSFLIWLNAEADAGQGRPCPTDGWLREAEVVVSTCPEHPVGTEVAPGESMTLDGRTVVVVREV